MAEGHVSAGFGYGSLSAGLKPLGKAAPMTGGPKLTPAPAQLLPDEPIGIQPAQSSPQKSGGGGILDRGLSFLKGIGEGRPGGDLPEAAGSAGGTAAGGAEAAGGADAIAELAPLALAAL